MALKVFSRSHGFLTCFRANFRSDLRFLQGNGIFAKTSAFSACPTYFQRVFLSAGLSVFFGKTAVQTTDSERKNQKSRRQRKRRQLFTVRFSSFVPICALPASICDRRINFRRFRLFGRILRAFAGALLQSRRSGLFKRVFRRFTSLYAPVKEVSFLAFNLRFKLFSASHREFLFKQSVCAF